MNNVIVEYNDFSKDNSNVEKITFDLLPNVSLTFMQDASTETDESGEAEKTDATTNEGVLTITMVDKQTDETEITGSIDIETLNALIRSLIIFRGQIA